MQVRRLVVTGVVQGVGFRVAMAAQARQLEIVGWVRNRRNGSVEAMIAGEAAAVAAMLDWSRHGPAGAIVEQLVVEDARGAFGRFEILPTP